MVDPRELFEARDRMEWSEVKSSQLKVVAAGIGAGALVSMGALTVVFSDAPGSISEGPEITMGETSTSTTAPLSVETSIATPEVDGFDARGLRQRRLISASSGAAVAGRVHLGPRVRTAAVCRCS